MYNGLFNLKNGNDINSSLILVQNQNMEFGINHWHANRHFMKLLIEDIADGTVVWRPYG